MVMGFYSTSLYISLVKNYSINMYNTTTYSIHIQITKNGHDFNLPAHKNVLFVKKPSYAGARLSSALPN